jgi:hypothetical protein
LLIIIYSIRETTMKRHIITSVLLSAALSVFLLIHGLAFAQPQETTKEALAKILNEEKDICKAVKKAIQQKLSTKDIVKLYIQMGHDACLVVRCAIQAKGDLEQIITGALEGGATPDVCSRCAIEAGAEPDAVARILAGYSLGEEQGLEPITLGLPGTEQGGGPISPSSPAP